jgi:CRP/FNR family transcriptional regulator
MIRRAARLVRVPRRQHIYWCGDRSDRVFFLQAGVVKIAAPDPDADRKRVLMFIYSGDAFGEDGIIEGGPRDHLAEAHEDSVVWAIHREALMAIIDQSPALGKEFIRLMARRTRHFRIRLEGLLGKDAHTRVASTLLNLAAEHAIADADGLLIPTRLTQGDLADMTGLARETVNGVLADLRARGLVEVNRWTVRIKRPSALRPIQTMSPSITRDTRDVRIVA